MKQEKDFEPISSMKGKRLPVGQNPVASQPYVPGSSFLNERDLPLSPMFIDFLAQWLDNRQFSNELWFDQRSEALSKQHLVMRRRAQSRLQRLVSDTRAQVAIGDVYRWFRKLATAHLDELREFQLSYKFLAIVGAPRSGGSYLTGELFSALGYEPNAVPACIAHDGFPEVQPHAFNSANNAWITTLLSVSEYLTMLNTYFPRDRAEPTIVPKKLTKGIYAGSFFNALFGKDAEYLITIRNPVSCCISTYEKSGGLPAGGRFRTRSTMEHWIARDLLATGSKKDEIDSSDYFTVYARYWEQYYITLAMSGLTANTKQAIVPFGDELMEEAASDLHTRFSSKRRVSNFEANKDSHMRHPEWKERCQKAMERVDAAWQVVGWTFPWAELNRGM